MGTMYQTHDPGLAFEMINSSHSSSRPFRRCLRHSHHSVLGLLCRKTRLAGRRHALPLRAARAGLADSHIPSVPLVVGHMLPAATEDLCLRASPCARMRYRPEAEKDAESRPIPFGLSPRTLRFPFTVSSSLAHSVLGKACQAHSAVCFPFQ